MNGGGVWNGERTGSNKRQRHHTSVCPSVVQERLCFLNAINDSSVNEIYWEAGQDGGSFGAWWGAPPVPIPALFGAIPAGGEEMIPADPKPLWRRISSPLRPPPGSLPSGRSLGRDRTSLAWCLFLPLGNAGFGRLPERRGCRLGAQPCLWFGFPPPPGPATDAASFLPPDTPKVSRSTWQRRCRQNEPRSPGNRARARLHFASVCVQALMSTVAHKKTSVSH